MPGRPGAAHRRSSARLAAAMLLLILGAGGCIFDTREPEGGGGGEQVPWVSPESMRDGLGNMERALEAKILTNYGRSFAADELLMELAEGDKAELGGENPFDPWSASQEEQRMSGILGSTEAELTVEWTVRDSVPGEKDDEWYYQELGYLLRFEKPDSVAEYSGNVNLYFRDDGTGQWFVFWWQDLRDDTGRRTWGWLRASNKVEFQKR